jgi:hypothetical protein
MSKSSRPTTLVIGMTAGSLVPYKTAAGTKAPVLGDKQREIVTCCLREPGNFIVDGDAGTGKTTVGVYLATTTVEGWSERCVCITVGSLLGGTSLATIRASKTFGSALSAFKLDPTDIQRIVIEEAWMMPAPLMDTLDTWMQTARGDLHHPFGGIPQIVLIGDWLIARSHLVTHPTILKAKVSARLVLKRFTLTQQMRFDDADEDDYDALLKTYKRATAFDVDNTTFKFSQDAADFQDRVLYGSQRRTRASIITVGLRSSNTCAAQWKIHDKCYKAPEFEVYTFGPTGMLPNNDPRTTDGCFPVAVGCPIRFIRDVYDDPETSKKILVHKGELGTVVSFRESRATIYTPKKGTSAVVVSLWRPTGPVEVELVPPFLSMVRDAVKVARNDPDGAAAAPKRHRKLVAALSWPFITAWSLNIIDIRGLDVCCRIMIDANPRITDPIGMSLLYTAMTRTRTFLNIKSTTSSASLYRPDVEEETTV